MTSEDGPLTDLEARLLLQVILVAKFDTLTPHPDVALSPLVAGLAERLARQVGWNFDVGDRRSPATNQLRRPGDGRVAFALARDSQWQHATPDERAEMVRTYLAPHRATEAQLVGIRETVDRVAQLDREQTGYGTRMLRTAIGDALLCPGVSPAGIEALSQVLRWAARCEDQSHAEAVALQIQDAATGFASAESAAASEALERALELVRVSGG